MTTDDVRRMLREACRKAGAQKAWADQVGISASHVHDVLNGCREPASAICQALGIERVVTYRKVRGAEGRTR